MVLSSVLNVDTLDHCSTRTENQKREIFLIPTDTSVLSKWLQKSRDFSRPVCPKKNRPLHYWFILRTLVVDMCSPQFRNLKPLKGFWLMMLIVSSVIFLLCMIIICGGLVCRPAWLDKYFTYKIPSTQSSLVPSPETVKRSRKQSRISNKIEGMVVLDVFGYPSEICSVHGYL